MGVFTRREAIKMGAVALAAPVTVSMTGCTITKAQLEAYAADVDSGAAAIASALGASSLATTIKNDLAVFDNAVEAWTGGSAVQEIVSASKILEIALGAVGLPAGLVATADVIINVLDTILSNWPTAAKAAPAITAKAEIVSAVRPRVARIYKSRSEAVADWDTAKAGTALAGIKFK